MDADRLATLSRSLTDARSRRGALSALLAGAVALLGLSDSAAKKKKGKGKGKKKKKNTTQSPPPPSGGSAPPPADPVAMPDATCVATTTTGFSSARLAQTFRALRSGQLTSASVFLRENAHDSTFEMEIRSVDEDLAPHVVLASTTIANVPITVLPTHRTLTGIFATPATVVEGVRYALVITTANTYSLSIGEDDPCPDGHLFLANTVDSEEFTAFSTLDMRFESVVFG